MLLKHIDEQDFLIALKKSQKDYSCIFQIILIDKKTIFAHSLKRNSDIIELSCSIEDSIYIPLDKIAGINIIKYIENKIMIDSENSRIHPAINKSAYDYMKEDSLSYANKNNFHINHDICLYCLIATKPFKWGDLSYKTDTALYADWNYLQNISGGINALGVGVGIFSLSSGWSKSLWTQFKNKVKQKSIDINKINSENEAVIQGYISFIKSYHELPNFETSIDTIEMEGATWIPAIISNKKILNTVDIQNNTWTLIYLREDGMMFPLNVWDRISNPIKIYCEIIHATISTEFGTIPFYLKARCAAYIKE